MKKRLLSLLLALVMLVGMIPATSLTAFAAAADSVWVGGVEMANGTYLANGATKTHTIKPSGGYAYYKDGTLTLNNYSYEGKGYQYNSNLGFYATVYAEHDLTVELVGTNTLTQTTEQQSDVICVSNLVSDPDLTVDGNGKLIGTADDGIGLCADGDLTINGGTIAVTTYFAGIMSFSGNVIINGGDIIAESKLKDAACIYASYAVTINGGNVTAISAKQAIGYGRSVTLAKDLNIRASTTADGELGEYVAANHTTYKKIVITSKSAINNVNVSATFSGTPAKATTSTTGATVTATKWYRKNGSSWTELGASDTIKEGNTYRCEVTVGATGDYKLADGYTVKINGTAATKKSGNTWYRDVTITGYTSYVDVYDIALPEAGAHPDFTFNDEDCYHSSVALVEWFECDKDGKKLSGALSADYKFKEDSYYRLEVTAVPDANYEFDTRNLGFYIGPKAVQYYYPYQDTTYPDSVTGWKVYHVDDANGTYTVQIGDITLKDGDYLANNATAVTTTKPSGGYAYYKDGVLTLNNFVAAKLVRYYERYLEVELIGENKIGAIADYYYWDTTSNNYYTGLEFRGTGDLEFDEYYGHPYCNVSVNGDVFFNGSGDILLDAEFYCFQYTDNVIINDGYVYCYTAQDSVFGDDTIIEVNGGKLQMFDAGCWDKFLCNGTLIIAAGNVYVSDNPRKIEWEDCVPWDGVTDLNTYDNVWIVPKPEIWVGGVGMYDGDYLAVGATATQTTKPSGGYAYYKDGTLTLNNYSYEGKGYLYQSILGDDYAVIYSKKDLTLELIGNNTLNQTDLESEMIYVDGANLTVGGDGKLTGTSRGYALRADKDITINGGTVEVSASSTSILSWGDVIINGGDIVAESVDRMGIYANDITINGGDVTAIGGNKAIQYDLSDGFSVAEGMKIQASTTADGELGEYVAENHNSYKKIVIKLPVVYVGGVAMYDGDYLAVGATATQTTKPSGGYAYYNDGTLTLNNYSYEGKGYLNSSSRGDYAVIYSENDLTLELIGNNTLTQTESNSDMIYVDGANLTVGGDGKLTGTSEIYALFADKDITINGGTVEVSTNYVCISCRGDVIINGGDITAETENYAAIYSNYDVTVNGGNVTAIGGYKTISCALDGFSVAEGLKIQASTTVDGELGEYVAANHYSYKKIVITDVPLRDKITQMMMVDFRYWDENLEDSVSRTGFTVMNDQVRKIFEDNNFGAVILFSNNIQDTEQIFNLTKGFQEAATKNGGTPLMIAADQEGGSVYRLGTGTALPGNMALGATYATHGTKYAKEAGKIIGSELSALGINTNFAPVLDVNNNANNPVIGLRSYSDHAVMVGELAAAEIEGMAQYNLIGCAKHFPGHGDTATDSTYGLPLVNKALSVLEQNELKPYEVAIEKGVDMIMTAHILYPQLESDKILSSKTGKAESLPATMSDDILTDLLKVNMGFEGIIVTDAMNMAGITANWDTLQSCVIAINAGVDMLCMPVSLYDMEDYAELVTIIDGIEAAVKKGDIPMSRINDAYNRIMKVKENRGILNYNADEYTLEKANAVVGCEANREMEREISAAAVTVIKNENNVLPLNLTGNSKVLMLVPYSNESGQMIMAWNRAKQAGFIPDGAEVDYFRFNSATISADLKAKLDWADTYIIISEISSTARMEGKHWLSAAPYAFCDYAEENGKIAIIASVDKPYDVQSYPKADAIVAAYGCKGSSVDPAEALKDGLTSSEAAYGPNIIAAVEVILGTYGAQGKLPLDIPVYDEESNCYLNEISYDRGYGLTYDAKKEMKIYVGGVAMFNGTYLANGATTTTTTKPSGGYAYYKDGTLTLNNYSYEGDGYEYDSNGDYSAVIYSKNDLTLELIGNNTLTQTKPNSDMIYVYDAALTVSGNGKLIGTAGECALFAYSDLTINGGNIALSTNYHTIVSNYGDVFINGGDIVAESKNGAGIDAYDVTINGGNVTAVGGYTAINYDLFGSLTVAEDMEIRASTTVDGELGEYVAENHRRYKKIVITTPDIYVGGVGMNDGDYLAVGATATQTTKPSGGYAYYKDGTLTLNNYSYEGEGYVYGAVYINGTDLTIELLGDNTLVQTKSGRDAICANYANLTIDGTGKLTCRGGDYGIWVGKVLTINGGTITAIGNQAIRYNSSYGFTVADGLTIQASTTIDGALGEYVAANHDSYKKIVIAPAITLTGSATDGIKVKVEKLSGSATLIVAQYEGGKMVDVQMQTVSANNTYGFAGLTHKTGCTYKAFLVNSTSYAPLCAADEF